MWQRNYTTYPYYSTALFGKILFLKIQKFQLHKIYNDDFFCKKNSVRKMFPFFANNSLISSLSMKSKILCKVTISYSYFIFSGLHML